MQRFIAAAVAAAILSVPVLSVPALAQDHSHHAAPAKPGEAASITAYKQANEVMHRDMAIAFTGDADVDFVRGMIAHHQGAIDMAKVQLQYGTDPAIRRLSEEIIAAQEGEIRLMRDWLKARGLK